MFNSIQKKWKSVLALRILMLLVFAPVLCFAEEYPTKPITMIVASAVGGNADITPRLLAKAAEKDLGQAIVIVNNGGGAGAIALDSLAKAKPDGYYIAACPHTPLVEIPVLRRVPYKMEDFTPIMQFIEPQAGVVVRSDSPYKTLKDLVEYARKNPGKVTFSISGVGNPMHLAMMHIAKKEGIEWTAIPVPGGDPNMPLLGGHVTAFSSSTSWKKYVDEGKFRALATYGNKRINGLPNVPTLKELGYDFVADMAFIILAPKGTPQPIIRKLDEVFKKAMDDSAFIAYADKMVLGITYRNYTDTKQHLEDLKKRFQKTVVDLKLPREQ